MADYRKYVAGKGKNSGGRFILIEANSKVLARLRFNRITNDSDRGSIFRTKVKKIAKKSKGVFRVYYDTVYDGTKKR